jgi:hypothetical protein
MPFLTESREAHKLDLAVEVLRSSGAICLRAFGTSMLPSIWPGEVLRIENRPGKEIVPGDIVLVARDSRFVIHRVIEKHGSHWITRGDSLLQNDVPVADIQVLGKVSAIHRMSRLVVPNQRVTPLARGLAWMLCRWDSLRNIALHIHSSRQRIMKPIANGVSNNKPIKTQSS